MLVSVIFATNSCVPQEVLTMNHEKSFYNKTAMPIIVHHC